MNAIEAVGLGKRFGRRWALRDCTLGVPAGRVVGLVGANGAGKSTLLQLIVGLLAPTHGRIGTLGARPGSGPYVLGRVGFVAQDAPVYRSLTVGDHLTLGRRMNPQWDSDGSAARIEQLGLDLGQRAGHLSGGQRAQLALTLAIGKQPELLVLDEPLASLDPLARREFLGMLMGSVAETRPTVVLSSHLLTDIERVCDYLVVVARGRIMLAGDVDALLASHKVLTGPRRDPLALPADQHVVHATATERQTTLVVRTERPVLDPDWVVANVGLEDLVLAYMTADGPSDPTARHMSVVPA